jgi:hypothetical protein
VSTAAFRTCEYHPLRDKPSCEMCRVRAERAERERKQWLSRLMQRRAA